MIPDFHIVLHPLGRNEKKGDRIRAFTIKENKKQNKTGKYKITDHRSLNPVQSKNTR